MRPPTEEMGRIFGAEIVAVIRGFFAAIVGKIVPAVIALTAGDISADHHAIALAERYAFEVRVLPVAADRRDRAYVFMSLDDGELQRAIAVLCGVTLKRVLIRSADSGHLHFDQHATGSRVRQRIFSNLVLPGFYQCRCEYACGCHVDSVDASPVPLFDANSVLRS